MASSPRLDQALPGHEWHFPAAKRLGFRAQWQDWNQTLIAHLRQHGLDHVFLPDADSAGQLVPRIKHESPATSADIRRVANIVYWGASRTVRERAVGQLKRDAQPRELWERYRQWFVGPGLDPGPRCSSPGPRPSPTPASVSASDSPKPKASPSGVLSSQLHSPSQFYTYNSALVSLASIRLSSFNRLPAYVINFNSHRKKLMQMGCGLTDRDYIVFFINGIEDAPEHRHWTDQAMRDLERDPKTTLHHVQFIAGGLPQKPAGFHRRPRHHSPESASSVSRSRSPGLLGKHASFDRRPRDPSPEPASSVPRSRSPGLGQKPSETLQAQRVPALPRETTQQNKDRRHLPPINPYDKRRPGTCIHRNHRPEDCFIGHPELRWQSLPDSKYDSYKPSASYGPVRRRSSSGGDMDHEGQGLRIRGHMDQGGQGFKVNGHMDHENRGFRIKGQAGSEESIEHANHKTSKGHDQDLISPQILIKEDGSTGKDKPIAVKAVGATGITQEKVATPQNVASAATEKISGVAGSDSGLGFPAHTSDNVASENGTGDRDNSSNLTSPPIPSKDTEKDPSREAIGGTSINDNTNRNSKSSATETEEAKDGNIQVAQLPNHTNNQTKTSVASSEPAKVEADERHDFNVENLESETCEVAEGTKLGNKTASLQNNKMNRVATGKSILKQPGKVDSLVTVVEGVCREGSPMDISEKEEPRAKEARPRVQFQMEPFTPTTSRSNSQHCQPAQPVAANSANTTSTTTISAINDPTLKTNNQLPVPLAPPQGDSSKKTRIPSGEIPPESRPAKRKLPETEEPKEGEAPARPVPKKRWSAADLMKRYQPRQYN